MKDESDFSLLERAPSGDPEAFEQLAHCYTPRLYRVVRRVVNDESEAEVVMQDAFLRFWENRKRYKNDRPFFPYLVALA